MSVSFVHVHGHIYITIGERFLDLFDTFLDFEECGMLESSIIASSQLPQNSTGFASLGAFRKAVRWPSSKFQGRLR
jgi:hypothetical protein